MTQDDFDFESMTRYRGRDVATTVAELGHQVHVSLVLENSSNEQTRRDLITLEGVRAGHSLITPNLDARNAVYDREFDGKPNPWVPDESDLES